MTPNRPYPDEPADRFERPPISFEDRDGRSVTVRDYEATDDAYESLVEMYVAYDPEDRAQGIPPSGERQVRDWLDNILSEDCTNVVSILPDGRCIGHATLVPDGSGAFELAIFVLAAYQGAGIGTHLIEGLLGAGQEAGIERVWLTVERWNHPAVALYRKVGFEISSSESFEMEMSMRLQ